MIQDSSHMKGSFNLPLMVSENTMKADKGGK